MIANTRLKDEALAHFNEPMLVGFDVARCIGYGEDDSDCYIIVKRPNPHNDVIWHTMVGGYTWLDRLKGQGYVKSRNGEDWDDLYRLDSDLELNGSPKEAEPLVLHDSASSE